MSDRVVTKDRVSANQKFGYVIWLFAIHPPSPPLSPEKTLPCLLLPYHFPDPKGRIGSYLRAPDTHQKHYEKHPPRPFPLKSMQAVIMKP